MLVRRGQLERPLGATAMPGVYEPRPRAYAEPPKRCARQHSASDLQSDTNRPSLRSGPAALSVRPARYAWLTMETTVVTNHTSAAEEHWRQQNRRVDELATLSAHLAAATARWVELAWELTRTGDATISPAFSRGVVGSRDARRVRSCASRKRCRSCPRCGRRSRGGADLHEGAGLDHGSRPLRRRRASSSLLRRLRPRSSSGRCGSSGGSPPRTRASARARVRRLVLRGGRLAVPARPPCGRGRHAAGQGARGRAGAGGRAAPRGTAQRPRDADAGRRDDAVPRPSFRVLRGSRLCSILPTRRSRHPSSRPTTAHGSSSTSTPPRSSRTAAAAATRRRPRDLARDRPSPGLRRRRRRPGRARGLPVTLGRSRRTVPPALRRLLEARDERTCCFPGCESRTRLQAHHLEHWAHGGETSLDNLVLLCWHHHRLVHEGGYTVESDAAGGLRFRNPRGLVTISSPPRPPPGDADALLAENDRLGLELGPRTNHNGRLLRVRPRRRSLRDLRRGLRRVASGSPDRRFPRG